MKKIKRLNFLSLILFVATLITALIHCLSLNEISYTYSQRLEAIDYFTRVMPQIPTTNEIINETQKLYGTNYKIFFENYSNTNGNFNLITRKLTIDYNIIETDLFATTLAHELEHSKWVINENKATYRAIIRLWESDNIYLQYCAGYKAMLILNRMSTNQHNCIINLIDYYKQMSN